MLFKEIYFFSGYYFLNNLFENYLNKKNARNLVAATHALGSVLLNGTVLFTNNFWLQPYTLYYSIGYFLYDGYYIIRFDKMKFLNYCYLYHHFASLYMLYNHNNLFNVHTILFFAELSNLPSYLIYHNLHLENKNDNQITLYKNIQKGLYTLIRVPVMSYILKNLIFNLDFNNINNIAMFGITFPVYLMGIFWSFRIITE